MFPKKKCNKGEDGKPVTAPRNFYTGKFYRGKVEGHPHGDQRHRSSYFSKGLFNATGDKYLDPHKRQSNKVTQIGDVAFKPQSVVKHNKAKPVAPYEYVPQGSKVPDPKRFRDPESGMVEAGPANIFTRPRYHHSKTWNSTFGGPIPAQVPGRVDNYDA